MGGGIELKIQNSKSDNDLYEFIKCATIQLFRYLFMETICVQYSAL